MPESSLEMAHLGGDEKPARASSMSLAKMASRKFKGSAEKTLSAQEQRIKINDVKKIMGPIADKFPVFCSDASISRYLRARSWNTKKAAKMLKATLKWRLEFKPEKIRWEDIAEEAVTGKVYKASYFDKSGRTVLVMKPGLQNTSNVVGQLKHLVYCMEDAIMTMNSSEQEQEQEKMVWLIDFEGWSMGSVSVKAARETATVLQNHYPERLGLAILYNPPKVFESFWKMVRPFLESKTHKKAKFVYSSDPGSQKIMEELFDMDKLECSFGGRSSARFDYDGYMKWMKEDEKKRALLTSNNSLGSRGSETPSTSCPPTELSNSDEEEGEEGEEDEEVATPPPKAKEKAEEMPLSLRRFCEDDYY